MYQFSADLVALQQRNNEFLRQQLNSLNSAPAPLADAMRYSLLLGGKRIRPFLVYATGRMLGVPLEKLDHLAGAIECIHCYSLIHDDLPAMDNDTLRRNQPTCHIAFDEATAILAGDALQSYAFELLSQSPLTDAQKIQQLSLLAKASGAQGMCLGQSLDLISENKQLTLTELERIHNHKTGALITASVLLGFYASDYHTDKALEQKLRLFSQAIGLAFQVQDDILDITSNNEELGKNAGSDLKSHKSTYPQLLGLEQAKQKAQDLYLTAQSVLEQLAFDTTALSALAEFIIQRRN
ncbi:geranyl transferase [Gallibacterium salpingitidis]|uniref:Geranyl transferase n=1 Tax=Gallibacterium salpingitidis TaxID=505341 RepID=A0AB36DZJ2_9PAST|nr:(2E,6E)-farnesyl diphosphate synthase [Gallibacterium salpingitidis]OBX06672.1 geranyl transferase [Gallibacterium salpingitidis]OBX07764.1 geranyl transferase [Gallibacterium salpingitidis]WKT00689.1 (2E,6E)-farnesyl diphosphate synthase [Gallibacterium salpingitidis]